MALSLRKSSAGGTVGLDIDGRYLAAAQVEGGSVVRGVSLDLPAGLVSDGEVVNRDGLADALKRFVAETGLPKNVRLGVANQQIVVRVVELPRIEDEKQRDAAVRFQAAEAIAMPLDEAVLDHQVAGYAEAPDGSPRMQVVVVAARRSMIEALLDAAKHAGLRPDGVDLDAFALVRMLAVATDTVAGDTARVYCHLGGVSNLAIAVGTACFFTRPLAAVWDDEGAGAQLADEIRLSIDYYMTQPQAKPVGEIVVSGPGSADEELVDSLGVHLGLPTTVAAPLGMLDRSALNASEDPHRLTVAAGLAMGEGRMKAVNLIPTEQRRAQATGKRSGSAYVLVGLLVTLLALVGAYVFTSNHATDSKNKAVAAKSEADRLEAEVKQRGAFTNFAEIKKARLASVMGVAETRFDWERLMREISRVMPGGSWLQSTDASMTGQVDGESTTTAAGTPVAATPKAKFVGCTPDQSDVARMMVRMRQMNRVSDVELNESSTEVGNNTETSVDSCGRYYQFDITVSFTQTPQSEAPRGESSVPASLGGGS